MFYCDSCASSRGWPTDFYLPRSRGNCEVCGNQALCFDVPSKNLRSRENSMPKETTKVKEPEPIAEGARALGRQLAKQLAAMKPREIVELLTLTSIQTEALARELSGVLIDFDNAEATREVLKRLPEEACELVTDFMGTHPEGWDGPCGCRECLSYADEAG